MEPWQEEALLQQRQQAYGEYQDKTSRWYQDQNYLTTMQAQDREYMNLLLSMGYEPSDEELSRAGMTRDQATILTDYYESLRNGETSPASTRSGGGGSGNNKTGVVDDGTVDLSVVPDNILDQVNAAKTPEEAEKILNNAEAGKVITHDQALALMSIYNAPTDNELPLMQRQWSVENNGGVNWFWGVDNNATVKDNSGNVYRLDDLIDALVEEGVPKATAKTWVKDLQKNLGI